MTFEKIRAALPTHIMLTPGVHRWREGDEIANYISHESGYEWEKLPKFYDTKIHGLRRRPIPPHILDSQAWWVLYDKCATVNSVPRFDQAMSHFIITIYDHDDLQLDVEEESAIGVQRGFNGSSEAYASIKILGGESEIINRLSEGRLYDKWLLEQMEDV